MKKLVLLISMSLFLAGCAEKMQKEVKEKHASTRKIIALDGCEYYESISGVGDSSAYSMTHKGNCPNPIHSCKR